MGGGVAGAGAPSGAAARAAVAARGAKDAALRGGGTTADWAAAAGGAAAAARAAVKKTLIELADEHGSDLRIWGAGRGFDRIIQCSMKTGWVDPNNMRPTTMNALPKEWDRLGIRMNESCIQLS